MPSSRWSAARASAGRTSKSAVSAGWSSAFEYQRSELAADRDDRAWKACQGALAAEHDHVIWLLDPVRVENHPTNSRAAVASELMRAMARRGLPVRVLDVAERRVTSVLPWGQEKALLEASNVYRGFAGTRATEHFIQFGAALEDCTLVDGQKITPTDRRSPSLAWTTGSIPNMCRDGENQYRCHRWRLSHTMKRHLFRPASQDSSRHTDERRKRTSQTFPLCTGLLLRGEPRRPSRRLRCPSNCFAGPSATSDATSACDRSRAVVAAGSET